MASSAVNKAMKNTNQDPPPPPPHHQQPLKCPRCDSSNTKFCYYNNYSLSQPRHFCKACKRYWTRGGTLRNVPVGGGCRKNKRSKRQSSSGGDGASSATSAATANHSARPQIDLPPASNRMHNPLFYSPLEPNFPFSSFGSTRVSSDTTGFDLHSQMNGLGLGFSYGHVVNEVINNDYKNGFKPIQDSSPFLPAGSSNNNIFFGSSSFASTSTMTSLLASSLHQNPIEQINSSDPSSLLWSTTNVGAWLDPSNMGSSVPSLI